MGRTRELDIKEVVLASGSPQRSNWLRDAYQDKALHTLSPEAVNFEEVAPSIRQEAIRKADIVGLFLSILKENSYYLALYPKLDELIEEIVYDFNVAVVGADTEPIIVQRGETVTDEMKSLKKLGRLLGTDNDEAIIEADKDHFTEFYTNEKGFEVIWKCAAAALLLEGEGQEERLFKRFVDWQIRAVFDPLTKERVAADYENRELVGRIGPRVDLVKVAKEQNISFQIRDARSFADDEGWQDISTQEAEAIILGGIVPESLVPGFLTIVSQENSHDDPELESGYQRFYLNSKTDAKEKTAVVSPSKNEANQTDHNWLNFPPLFSTHLLLTAQSGAS